MTATSFSPDGTQDFTLEPVDRANDQPSADK
jgi:hypothetical protein